MIPTDSQARYEHLLEQARLYYSLIDDQTTDGREYAQVVDALKLALLAELVDATRIGGYAGPQGDAY